MGGGPWPACPPLLFNLLTVLVMIQDLYLQDLRRKWMGAAAAAENYAAKIAPGDRFDLCEPWELEHLESLERRVYEYKLAYIELAGRVN